MCDTGVAMKNPTTNDRISASRFTARFGGRFLCRSPPAAIFFCRVFLPGSPRPLFRSPSTFFDLVFPMNEQVNMAGRYAACAAFVLLWTIGGFLLHLNPVAFQLAGLPLMAVFQLAVARRSVGQVWARDAAGFRVDGRTALLAAGLFVVVAVLVWQGWGRVCGKQDIPSFLLLLLVAVLPGAFALRQQRAADLRRAAVVIVAAAVIRVAWRVAWAPTFDGAVIFPADRIPGFIADGLAEFIALFLVDEVAFRGVLDPYLCWTGEGRVQAWCSAIFISILWGFWHLPAYNPAAKTLGQLIHAINPTIFLQVIFGTALTFCSRVSRTLVPSAAVHGLGNAYVLALIK